MWFGFLLYYLLRFLGVLPDFSLGWRFSGLFALVLVSSDSSHLSPHHGLPNQAAVIICLNLSCCFDFSGGHCQSRESHSRVRPRVLAQLDGAVAGRHVLDLVFVEQDGRVRIFCSFFIFVSTYFIAHTHSVLSVHIMSHMHYDSFFFLWHAQICGFPLDGQDAPGAHDGGVDERQAGGRRFGPRGRGCTDSKFHALFLFKKKLHIQSFLKQNNK